MNGGDRIYETTPHPNPLPFVRGEETGEGLSILDFVAMSFCVVLVRLAIFLILRGLVRAVAEWLIFGEAAHANPDRLCLRFDFQRPLVRFQNSAHGAKLTRSIWVWQALNPQTWTRDCAAS